ncbi:hypothetical protein J5N97_017236 [Dioscorea zingiberensis]|uniref:Uncharacterized protein n=1 Tax=Dioscorea zingiberensis TaxID=325984 RepID=A0A9D5HFY3_9LILI|nr:hypothetical protein J5N97_017236 [Dioscorea zingiberensis]
MLAFRASRGLGMALLLALIPRDGFLFHMRAIVSCSQIVYLYLPPLAVNRSTVFLALLGSFTTLLDALGPRNLAPFRFSRSGFFSLEWNPAKASIRCCAMESGVEGTVLGASHSKPRLSRLVGMGSKLVGCGSGVPKLLVSNDDLAQIVETSDEWISVRTGIHNRRVLTGNETLNGLAVDAAKGALDMAQVDADDVDLVIMCTSTPEDLFGGGGYQNILVIGADALSRYVDWTDRGTCILFGDAAGAVLVQACSGDEDGMLGFDLHSDGQGQRHLNAIAKDEENRLTSNTNGALVFPPRKSSYSCIQMNGKEVFRFAVRCVPQSIEAALEDAGLTSSSIDWLLLHQANQRIIDAVATRLQIPSEKVVSILPTMVTPALASIPLALDEAVRAGR